MLVGYFVQAERLDVAALLGALAALAFAIAQRTLSSPAWNLRRRVARVEGRVTLQDGQVEQLDELTLREPLERALRALSWAMVALASALAAARVFERGVSPALVRRRPHATT